MNPSLFTFAAFHWIRLERPPKAFRRRRAYKPHRTDEWISLYRQAQSHIDWATERGILTRLEAIEVLRIDRLMFLVMIRLWARGEFTP